jgi:uncharacterized protein YjiS (DUF1127 family)
MSLIDTSLHDNHALAPLAGWPDVKAATGLARLWERYQEWRARRETIRQLHGLDARMLRDLDITPREIESLVNTDGRGRTHKYDRHWWRTETERRRNAT